MSDREQTKAYVYQPLPATLDFDPCIYAVGGPGSGAFEGLIVRKQYAIALCQLINGFRDIEESMALERGLGDEG